MKKEKESGEGALNISKELKELGPAAIASKKEASWNRRLLLVD